MVKNSETAFFWTGGGVGGGRQGAPTAAASPSFPETCAPQLHSSSVALQQFSGRSGCGDGGSLRSRTVGLRTSTTVQRASLVIATKQEARVTHSGVSFNSERGGEGWCNS